MSEPIGDTESFWYCAPDGVGWIEFAPNVLEHLAQNRQMTSREKEAGGQLFYTEAPEGHMRVEAITGPRKTDKRSRSLYKPDRDKELAEIDEHFLRGLHFIGDWHTHPERIARPSGSDIAAITEIFNRSSNRGNGFLLVIVGTGLLQYGLSVSWCNGKVVTLKRSLGKGGRSRSGRASC